MPISTSTENVTTLRNLPLEEVLFSLGASPDPRDRHNWKTAQGRITVTGPKFYNHDVAFGGGGAIDLIMHLENLRFSEAVSRLEGIAGLSRKVAPPVYIPPPPPNLPPVPVEEHWAVVREYLTGIRGLGKGLIDRLHEEKLIYSDSYKNAVFMNEKRTGAELRGTGPRTFHGYRGEKAPFRLEGNSREIAFAESAIDALSLRQLEFSGTILSFGGAAKGLIEEHGRICQQQGLTVYGAFDNDSAGEGFFKILQSVAPRAERIIPLGKDWNDELLKKVKGEELIC